ncbi:MAG: tRNA uridine-5-carboxymethylaminomethyl(34) synthesis GTPase MnmE [Clostridia bacterium]|nr:tRNA uridine-5-carboxymethylaminomethyl(34) synthesis GTPase MnmE [Clostridia bacterium]
MINCKTIAAISTARGKGGVALIRISGDDALTVALKVMRLSTDSPEPRRCYYGSILRDGDIIDDGILTYFKAPSSFTGEDVCEICCHGGIYSTQAVLESVLSSGAALAEAGEFTKRAFLNGKLTLTRAEAIGNVIDAKTDSQLRLSSSQARGVLSSKLEAIREKIVSILAHAYVTIDYPDEDIDEAGRDEIGNALTFALCELDKLKHSYRAGRAITEGIKTAIIGKPNAGKSSIYNMLLGDEVAIVTDIAGTTRDIIESTLSLGGVTLNLADTAGIHKTEDTVEKIGVERALSKIESSELLLCVFDLSRKETGEDQEILEAIKDKCAIAILNKSDTPQGISKDFEEKIKENLPYVVYTSAKDKRGYEELCQVVSQLYDLGKIDISNDAIISNARQFSSVSLALDEAKDAMTAFTLGATNDIVCTSLENALSHLDMIDARGVSEEIVSAIFSRFCVGK